MVGDPTGKFSYSGLLPVMTAQAQTVFTCDRCGVERVSAGAHGRPSQWLSLREQRSDRELNVLPVDGCDLCDACADLFRNWFSVT